MIKPISLYPDRVGKSSVILWGRAVVAHQPHKLEVRGSSPLPAQIKHYLMGEEKKVRLMYAIYAPTIRGIVEQANELGIQKEDIVSILENEGQYVLTYYA